MPDEDQVWWAANRLRRNGERVSQRNVIAELQRHGRGGTSRQVGPHLLSWKVAHNYDARLEVNDIPDSLKGDLVGFVRGVWGAAMIEATQRLDNERARLGAENQAARELMDEAYVEAEVATREAEILRARVVELEAEAAPLRTRTAALEAEVAALSKRMSDMKAAEFWDRVMREIEIVLPPDVWVPDNQVIDLLPASLAGEANAHGEPLTRGMLNKKMGVRVTHRKYFEKRTTSTADEKVTHYRRRVV